MRQNPVAYYLICVLSIVIFDSPLEAQDSYTIKNFTNDNGLSQNAIIDMAMDYSGYLWIGTQNSLVRYDGSSFQTFPLGKAPKNNVNNYIWNLMNTPYDRKLMVKAKNGTIYSILNGKPVLFDSTLKNEFATIIFRGQYPTLALARQYNLPQKELQSNLKWGQTVQIVPLNENEFLKGENGARAINLYGKKGLIKEIQIPGSYKMMFRSQSNILVVCDEGDIYLFDKGTAGFTQLNITSHDKNILRETINQSTQSLYEGSNTSLYQGLYSGESFIFYNKSMYLLHIDTAAQQLDFVSQFELQKDHQWTKLVYDSINTTFFFATATEGIFRVKLQKIKTIAINDFLPAKTAFNDYTCYSILKTGDRTAVTPGGIFFSSTDTGISVRKLKNLFSSKQTIARLGDSALLCTTPSGLHYYLKKEDYDIPHAFNDSFNRFIQKIYSEVTLLYPEGDSVWVSCRDHLFAVTRNNIREFIPPANKQRNKFPALNFFYRISKDEVLISGSTGFYKLTLKGNAEYEEIPGIEERIDIRHVSPYKDVLIVSGYRGGLYILKNNKIYKVPFPDNIPELTECHSTYVDKQGYIWVTTNKGLFKSTAESVVAAATANGTIPYFYCYGFNDGIQNLEFNGGGVPAYAVMSDERLLYPSMGGVVTFKPQDLKDKLPTEPVQIESISIDKKIIEQDDTIILPADFSILDITPGVSYFGDPRNIVVEYRLDNNLWEKIPSTGSSHITIVKILSGIHQLAIRKRTGFGDNDFVYTQLVIDKKKHFFEQWWFFPIPALLVGGLIFLILKLQTRSINQKRKQLQLRVNEQTEKLSQMVRVKDMLISIITHDMLTPLKHVGFIADILDKGIERDPKKISDALKDIKDTSARIHSNSASIVNWIKYNNENIPVNKQTTNLYILIESVVDIYLPIAKTQNVEIVNLVGKSIVADLDQNIFSTILTNIFSNAVKNTSEGQIKVDIETGLYKDDRVLRIADTGKGIREDTLYMIREVLRGNHEALKMSSKVTPGLGFIIISELVRIHNLKITIESKEEKGTTISIYI